jgi:hypothetical protein
VRSLQSVLDAALNALGQCDYPSGALPVDSPQSGSSQSVGTTFVPETDEAITSTALISMHDRQNRLTSLLHLTVDSAAPHQKLPMAALPVEEPTQVDDASVGSSGDRAMPELQRQFALSTVRPVEAARGGVAVRTSIRHCWSRRCRTTKCENDCRRSAQHRLLARKAQQLRWFDEFAAI